MTESKYPGSLQVEPMKYGNKPSESQVLAAWSSGEWLAQEKRDGAWYQLEKTDNGEIYLFGRTLSKTTGEYTEKIANVPHIESWAQYLPNGTTLIGEIYVPGGKSNDVTKIMGCTAANAYKRQFDTDAYGGPIHYYIFDCIRYRGESLIDVPTVDRVEHYLEYELYDIIKDESYIELAHTFYDNFEKHLQRIFAKGGEGMVFKKKDCPYRPGKRTTTSQMFKYKEHLDTVDLVCMELLNPVKEYTGKEIETWQYYKDGVAVTKPYYYGWKNAMRLGAYNQEGKLIEVCRVASGFTDEMREDMAKNPDNYLEHVVEISCMSLNKKDKTVRHPVFEKVRIDKDAADCKVEEIFN